MSQTSRPTSPRQTQRVKRLSRTIWFTAILLVGVIAGAKAAQYRNAAGSLKARQSPAGPAYGQVIPSLTLDRPTLREALPTLARLSHADIRVDWNELTQVGVNCDRRLNVQLNLRNVTLDQVLPLVLHATDDEHTPSIHSTAEGGKIFIPAWSAFPQMPASLGVYDVRDILAHIHEMRRKFPDDEEKGSFSFNGTATPRPDDAGYLRDLIMNNVASDTWQAAGGTAGLITVSDGRLAVLQLPENQKVVAAMVNELRKDATMAETLPDPPWADEWDHPDLLRKVGDLSLHDVPLHEVIDLLRQKSGANIFVNWADMENHGVGRDEHMDLSVHDATLRQCVDVLIAELNVRMPSGNTFTWGMRGMLVIASRQNLEAGFAYPVVYPMEDLLKRKQQGGVSAAQAEADLLGRIEKIINPPVSPLDLKQPPKTTGRIWAGKLIVEQTLAQHHVLKRYLAQLREGK